MMVFYESRKGTTKKLADVVGAAVKVRASTVPPINRPNGEKLVFIGFGYEKGLPYLEIQDFCNGIDNNTVKNAAIFCTSDDGKTGGEYILDILKRKEINVVGEVFETTRPKLFSNRNKPDAQDYDKIKAWAIKCEKEVFGE